MSDRDFLELMYRIKARREKLGLSYQDLAALTGMSKSTLQRYETGEIKKFPVGKLPDLARALQTTEVELTGWNYSGSVPEIDDILIACYGDVKADLTDDDIDDIVVAMQAKAERNKRKKSGEQVK